MLDFDLNWLWRIHTCTSHTRPPKTRRKRPDENRQRVRYYVREVIAICMVSVVSCVIVRHHWLPGGLTSTHDSINRENSINYALLFAQKVRAVLTRYPSFQSSTFSLDVCTGNIEMEPNVPYNTSITRTKQRFHRILYFPEKQQLENEFSRATIAARCYTWISHWQRLVACNKMRNTATRTSHITVSRVPCAFHQTRRTIFANMENPITTDRRQPTKV